MHHLSLIDLLTVGDASRVFHLETKLLSYRRDITLLNVSSQQILSCVNAVTLKVPLGKLVRA